MLKLLKRVSNFILLVIFGGGAAACPSLLKNVVYKDDTARTCGGEQMNNEATFPSMAAKRYQRRDPGADSDEWRGGERRGPVHAAAVKE